MLLLFKNIQAINLMHQETFSPETNGMRLVHFSLSKEVWCDAGAVILFYSLAAAEEYEVFYSPYSSLIFQMNTKFFFSISLDFTLILWSICKRRSWCHLHLSSYRVFFHHWILFSSHSLWVNCVSGCVNWQMFIRLHNNTVISYHLFIFWTAYPIQRT